MSKAESNRRRLFMVFEELVLPDLIVFGDRTLIDDPLTDAAAAFAKTSAGPSFAMGVGDAWLFWFNGRLETEPGDMQGGFFLWSGPSGWTLLGAS